MIFPVLNRLHNILPTGGYISQHWPKQQADKEQPARLTQDDPD
jgi:hypothetical protein